MFYLSSQVRCSRSGGEAGVTMALDAHAIHKLVYLQWLRSEPTWVPPSCAPRPQTP